MNDDIFFKLWRNIVINREIFKFMELYKKNEIVTLIGLTELREYKEREFIGELILKSNDGNGDSDGDGDEEGTLLKGDLPEYGVLNKVDLSNYKVPITNCNVIPQGVKVLIFNRNGNEIQLSELPTSISSVSNIILKKPYSTNNIPNNITSITFKSFDVNEFYDIKFHNSITNLNLNGLRDKLIPPPPPSSIYNQTPFFPSSLIGLETYYNGSPESYFPTIPSSVKTLAIYTNDYCHFEKGFIPFGVNELLIYGCDIGGIKLIEGSIPESVTKLEIYFGIGGGEYNQIKPFVIPQSVVDLYIRFPGYPKSYVNLFPANLTRLSVNSLFRIGQPPKLFECPSTLKYLKIAYDEILNDNPSKSTKHK